MTSRERIERDAAIVSARFRGVPEVELASRYELDPSTVRRIMAEYRASRPSLAAIDPLEAVRDALDGFDEVIADLVRIAEETHHDSTRLGAIKARRETLGARIDLLRAAGVLPSDPWLLWQRLDANEVAKEILVVLDDEGVPERVQERIVATVESGGAASQAEENGELPESQGSLGMVAGELAADAPG